MSGGSKISNFLSLRSRGSPEPSCLWALSHSLIFRLPKCLIIKPTLPSSVSVHFSRMLYSAQSVPLPIPSCPTVLVDPSHHLGSSPFAIQIHLQYHTHRFSSLIASFHPMSSARIDPAVDHGQEDQRCFNGDAGKWGEPPGLFDQDRRT